MYPTGASWRGVEFAVQAGRCGLARLTRTPKHRRCQCNAGRLRALAVPTKSVHLQLERAEKALEPWLLFRRPFANAGVLLAGFTFGCMITPIPLGIAAGLFLGKQIAIFFQRVHPLKTGIAEIPQTAS